jgi:hypothetical protein
MIKILAILILISSTAFADKVATFGTPNSTGVYSMEAFDDRSIIIADDASLVVNNIEVDGNLYMGPATTDGSWRFTITGSSSLEFQRRESGNWVTKGKVEP